MAKKTVIVGSTVSAQQLGELLRQIADGGITREHLQAFLERRNPFAEAEASPATFLTADYFVTRSGLWESGDFVSRVTAAYPEALVPRGLDGVECFDLTKHSSAKTILTRPKMGGEENVRKHAFTPDQVAALIDLQLNGEAGKLLTNGCSNLLYVVGANGVLFVVRVYWDADNRKWEVDALRLDEGGRWLEGDRVFRNTRTF